MLCVCDMLCAVSYHFVITVTWGSMPGVPPDSLKSPLPPPCRLSRCFLSPPTHFLLLLAGAKICIQLLSASSYRRHSSQRCVGAALGAFLWLALLSGVCSGYRDSSSWQAMAPGAVPAEHKMARAFVVHLPIHTTQLEPVEDQRQPATIAAPPGGQASFETHGQHQGSLKKHSRRRRRRRKYYRTRSSTARVGPGAVHPKRGVRVRKRRPAV